uniref:AT-rich interaction domain 5B n=1 Tax=Myripristis murdjan TaxID=586833 RepID=A0A667Z576_9TELE
MEPNSLKWVGSSCGLHGPYIFYKAFKFNRDGKPRILSLGDFFFVRCKPEDPICIAELQLLWEERTSKQLLSSSKLYFLPEDTPQGRTVGHGEHEVIAVSEKVIVRLEDLVKWTVPDFSGWAHGLKAEPLKPSVVRDRSAPERAKQRGGGEGEREDGRRVLVLSYPQYCRYRSILARLREQPSSLLTDHTVLALGGIAALGGNTRILYCRDTFEHPALLQNESICDEFGECGGWTCSTTRPTGSNVDLHLQTSDSISSSEIPTTEILAGCCQSKVFEVLHVSFTDTTSAVLKSECKRMLKSHLCCMVLHLNDSIMDFQLRRPFILVSF